MKFKATKKEMKENFSTIIQLGYCSAHFLLSGREPIAYSTRAEGWACDYYQVGNVLISTGYAPIGNIDPDYEIVKEYEEKARFEHMKPFSRDRQWEKEKLDINALLDEFIAKVV